MKKDVIILLLLLLLPIISAVEVDMKTEFSQGETLMAKISGNFVDPILKEKIFFYRGHVRVGIVPDVAKINDEYYIYASLLNREENNYSISIEDVRYMIGNQVSEENIIQNFSITEDTADFSISKGFIIDKEDFFIELQNLQNSQITIQVTTNLDTTESSIDLKSGEIHKINFNIGNIEEQTSETIELSTSNLKYEIPVILYLNESASSEKERDFEFDPSDIIVSMSTTSNNTRIIYLYNTGDEDLENISLSLSNSLEDYVSLSVNEIEELDSGSSSKIEVYLFSFNEEESIEGQITAKIEDELYTYCAVILNFIEDYVPLDGESNIPSSKTCEELNGEICEESEECDGDLRYAKDGKCCLGKCEEKQESATGQIIGWGIIVVVVGFLIWFFISKYKKGKK